MTQTGIVSSIATFWNSQAPHETAKDAGQRFQWSVIPLDLDKRPCKTGGKHDDGTPKRLAWKKYQSERAHEKQIDYWHKQHNPSAWAIITGAISNVVVLDFDGDQGRVTSRRLGLEPHVRTGSGGEHVYFQHPGWRVPTLNSKSKQEMGRRWPGLDIRADGGYAAFCGRNESGPYIWLRDFQPEPLDILPDELRIFLGLMYSPDEAKARNEPAPQRTQTNTHDFGERLLNWALRRIVYQGRDNSAFDLACQLRDNDVPLAQSIMREFARKCPSINTKGQIEAFTEDDALAKLESANTRAARKPWESTLTPLEPIQHSVHTSNGNGSNGNHPPVATKERDSSLPQIYLSGQLREKWNVALNALREAEKKNPTIFIQSARLVQIGQDDKKHPIIMQLGIAELKNALSRSADYYRLKEKGDEIIPVEISPPKEIAEAILALNPGEWKFPSLEAIVETPVIRPDGSILDAPGYDEATRLYYYPQEGMKDCKIPDHPTKKDIAAALAIVDEAIGEFPYVDQADRANAYALLLTPFIRPSVRHVPLGLIDAPKQGTGKGLLSDTISVTSTGASAAILTLSDSDEELQKNITSLLIEGVTIITIDNISGKLQSKHLDGVLTADTWRGRILGQSKMVKVPQRATWIATGNNIRLGGDLARRCYRIRLDPHVSRPWMRKGFKHEDLLAWVTEHRSELIAALLTLARAWFVAGKPQYSDIPMLGTFTSWAKTVGGILQHCGVQGFLANLEQLYDEADEDSAQWEAFLIAWRKAFGENWKTTSEIVKELTPPADSAESVADSVLVLALPDALQEALKEKPKSFSIVLGKALEKRLEACFGDDNLRIERDVDKKTKAKKWRVVGTFADSADSSTRHTQDKNEFIQTDEKNDIEYDATNYPHYPQAGSVHTPQSSTTSQSTAQSVNADSSYTLSAQKKDSMPPWLIPGTSEWKKQVMRNGLDEMMRRRTAALQERAAQS